jgi:cell division septation protein DedD
MSAERDVVEAVETDSEYRVSPGVAEAISDSLDPRRASDPMTDPR